MTDEDAQDIVVSYIENLVQGDAGDCLHERAELPEDEDEFQPAYDLVNEWFGRAVVHVEFE